MAWQEVIDHGCYRIGQLRTAIRHYLVTGNDVPQEIADDAPVVLILAGTRKFNYANTGDEFLRLAGVHADVAVAIRLEGLLGDTVPEWFFPALCVVARRTDALAFPQEVAALLQLWGFNAVTSRTAAEFLEFYRPALQRGAPDTKWVVPPVGA